MTKSYKGKLPKTFVFELTKACNHRCVHCYTVWGTPNLQYEQFEGRPLSTSAWKKLIDRLHKDVPTLQNIALSGGEPLLHKDLSEIVRFISDHGLSTVVITNGSKLTKERAQELHEAGAYFEVPLLSHRPEVHDKLTGIKGSWDIVVENLADMVSLGLGWVSVFVATRYNYRDLPQTLRLAIALGAEGIMYNRVNLASANIDEASRLVPTPTMIKGNLATLNAWSKKHDFPIAVSVVIEPCVVDFSNYPHVHFGWCPLAGENSYFTVDPYGNLRICNHSPTVLGNLTKDPFVDIYRRHPYVQQFRTELPVECVDCPPEWRDLCRGGCKAAGEQCHGNAAQVDPFVSLNSATYKTI